MLNSVKSKVLGFINDESGVTAIEYGILAAGIAVVIGAVASSDGAFSEALSGLFDNIVDQMPESEGGAQ